MKVGTVLDIDFALLRQQKSRLYEVVVVEKDDLLEGLMGLLDELQDQAALEVGERVVFGWRGDE